MKRYYLNNETMANGSIEFRVNGDTYALVSFYQKPSEEYFYSKVIMLNQIEENNLFMAQVDSGIAKKLSLPDKMKAYLALRDEILNKKEK